MGCRFLETYHSLVQGLPGNRQSPGNGSTLQSEGISSLSDDLLIPQLLQKGIELGRFPIPLCENLLRGHGVLGPKILDGGDERPLVLPQVAIELLGQQPLEPGQDQLLRLGLGDLGSGRGNERLLLLFHFPLCGP